MRPAYMTAIASQVCATTPRSCVIRMIDKAAPVAQIEQQAQDLRLHGDVERGGRLVGDQEFGPQASASAIMTRCRMPPENSCG